MISLVNISESALLGWLDAFVWPFVRLGAMLSAAPLFGARTVPVRARVLLAVVLAAAIAPMIQPGRHVELFSGAGVVALGREVLIGASIGFLLQMLFAVFSMAGELVALTSGLAFATMVDPDRGTSVPLLGQYYVIIATLLFLALNGHLALIGLVVQSFTALRAGTTGFDAGGLWQLAEYGSDMFRSAVLVALPASTALLLANVAMGMIARSAPQLNIFAVGFPMTLLLGILFLLLSLPALAPQVTDFTAAVFQRAGVMVSALAPSGGAAP